MEMWGLSDRGQVRSENQDIFMIDAIHDSEQAIFAVCDGMGGANAGKLASEIAVTSFVTNIRESLKPSMSVATMKTLAQKAVSFANEAVYTKSYEAEEFSGMGTTIVGALVDKKHTLVINVGDSRAYLINKNGIEQITKDHSFVEEMVARGEITEEEARTHPNRNLITRALGAEETVIPDIYPVDTKDDDILLLCTDGLTNLLTEQQILFEIIHAGELKGACERLVRSANQHGGNDNITVVIARM